MNKGSPSGFLTLLTAGATRHFLSAYPGSAKKHGHTSNLLLEVQLLPDMGEVMPGGQRGLPAEICGQLTLVPCRAHRVPCIVMECQAEVGQQMTCAVEWTAEQKQPKEQPSSSKTASKESQRQVQNWSYLHSEAQP